MPKRYVSCAENLPPVHLNAKLLASTTSHPSNGQLAQRRKASRTHGAPNAKLAVERSRKRDAKAKLLLNVTPLPKFVPAVTTTADAADMKATSASRASSSSASFVRPLPIPMNFPRHLVKPTMKEVSDEAIESVDPALLGTDKVFIRDSLAHHGPALFHSLSSVKANPAKDKLPSEQVVTIADPQAILPTHMLAIFGKDASATASRPNESSNAEAGPSKPRKVTLFPVHNLVLASHCANLPPFPPTLPFPETRTSNQQVTLPVWPLCLPAPISYPALSTYLYTKRIDLLYRSLLPAPPTTPLEDDWRQIKPYAQSLAERFTSNLLLKHTLLVHGLWQNMCALGVDDTPLWDALDVMWEVCLIALAISTGTPTAVEDLDRSIEEEMESKKDKEEETSSSAPSSSPTSSQPASTEA